MGNYTLKTLSQVPAQTEKVQIQSLANHGYHSEQDFQEDELARLQNTLDMKSMIGKIRFQILKESSKDETILYQKSFVLDNQLQSGLTDLANFRMRTTSPVFITLTLKSVSVALENGSENASGTSKQYKEGKAVIFLQIIQIIHGVQQKSKVVMLQRTTGQIRFQLPQNESFLYFSIGIIEGTKNEEQNSK